MLLVQHIVSGQSGRDLITVKKSDSVEDAAKVLSEHRIGALVVTEDGKTLEGILSERDIVREIGKTGGASLSEPVESLMTKEVKTCEPGMSLLRVLRMMTDGRFRHLPVVQDGELKGVVSIGDVVKARIDEIQAENQAMTDMLSGR
ncbi:CBS domain-containing protein [Paracoccaceae bacterium GXU_MW_L88]